MIFNKLHLNKIKSFNKMMPIDLAIDVLETQKVKLVKVESISPKHEALLFEFPDIKTGIPFAYIKIYPKETRPNPIGHIVLKVNPDYLHTPMYYDFIKGNDAFLAIRDVVDNKCLYESFTSILK